MMKKLLLLLVIIVTLISCEVDRQALIIGRWNKINITGLDSIQETWTFDNTGDCFRLRSYAGETDTLIRGAYLVKNDILTITGESIIPYYIGDWQVHSIDEVSMALILQDVGLDFFEFTKED